MSGSHITIQLLPPAIQASDPSVRSQVHHDVDQHYAVSSPPPLHSERINLPVQGLSSIPLPVLTPFMSPQYLITLRSTYRSTSVNLAQTAFFGATLSYANLFTYIKPQPELLAWAASTFLVGAVGAGTMSFFGQFDSIWNEHSQVHSSSPYLNMQEASESTKDWLVGAYGWISCTLVLVGLGFLNLSMIVSVFKNGIYPSSNISYSLGGIASAGIFGILGSLGLVLGAWYVRYSTQTSIMRASGYVLLLFFIQSLESTFKSWKPLGIFSHLSSYMANMILKVNRVIVRLVSKHRHRKWVTSFTQVHHQNQNLLELLVMMFTRSRVYIYVYRGWTRFGGQFQADGFFSDLSHI